MPTTVNLKDRSYPIIVERGALSRAGKIVRSQQNQIAKHSTTAVIVSDNRVGKLYSAPVAKSLKAAGFLKIILITIPAGERSKTLEQSGVIIDQMIRANVHRDAILVALGGGVVGDLAGFVAATYMRGIPLVQVPTTLLAMVDSAIGGKTAVNHPLCKNLIGVFYQPICVISDPDVLATLPAREIRTGLAEVVKYGVICDASLFRALQKVGKADITNVQGPFYDAVIQRCSQIKASVVSHDEREAGLRMILNFGHTFGHAIEEATHFRKFTHGEAIAIGMVAAARLSYGLELCDEEIPRGIEAALENIGLPTQGSISLKAVLPLLQKDKKVRGDRVLFILPEKFGRVRVVNDVPVEFVREVLRSVGCR